MSALPSGLASYKRTPLFTEATVPAGLLKDHSTKEGTWGLIYVESGTLRYCITDPRRSPSCVDLAAGEQPGVVEPTIIHRVEPLGPVQFWVDFHRQPME